MSLPENIGRFKYESVQPIVDHLSSSSLASWNTAAAAVDHQPNRNDTADQKTAGHSLVWPEVVPFTQPNAANHSLKNGTTGQNTKLLPNIIPSSSSLFVGHSSSMPILSPSSSSSPSLTLSKNIFDTNQYLGTEWFHHEIELYREYSKVS